MKALTLAGTQRRITSLVVMLALAAVLVGCGARGAGQSGNSGGEGAEYTIRLSHVVATQTAKGLAANEFKRLVEERSEGRMAVEVFPNSELYGDEDEFQALQSGSVEMLAPTTSKFTTVAPNMQVLDLPFVFDDYGEISEVTAPETEVGQVIYGNPALEERNIRVLALWVDGFKQLAANSEIRTPEDMSDLNMRVQPSDVLRSMFEDWGARPTPVAFAELFTALEQGVVDGHENPYSVIFGSNAHEVQSYISESNHGTNVSVPSVNQDFFDSLPEDLQRIVTESAQEAAEYNRRVAEEQNAGGKQKILDAGTTEIVELSEDERGQLRDAVVPGVWDEYADVIGREAVEELKARQGEQ